MSKVKLTIAEELSREMSQKKVKVNASVIQEFSDKIDFICNRLNIKKDEYLGKLLENSEISKTYSKLYNDSKKSNSVIGEGEKSENHNY